MKPEMLESLLLDRALGELAPEVAALLDSHLAREPDAARRAAELADTLRLARAAVATPPLPPRRPLDADRLRHAQRTQATRLRRTELLRLAACLTLGLGLGWIARTPPPRPAPAATPPPTLAESARARPAPSFWSLSRLAAEQRTALASARHHENPYELNWSPAPKLPRREDQR